jgi:hypothetical protein
MRAIMRAVPLRDFPAQPARPVLPEWYGPVDLAGTAGAAGLETVAVLCPRPTGDAERGHSAGWGPP